MGRTADQGAAEQPAEPARLAPERPERELRAAAVEEPRAVEQVAVEARLVPEQPVRRELRVPVRPGLELQVREPREAHPLEEVLLDARSPIDSGPLRGLADTSVHSRGSSG